MNWFKEIFCDKDGTLSSKRIFGGIGYLTVGIIISAVAIKIEAVPALATEYMYTSAALIGLGSVLKTIKNNETN